MNSRILVLSAERCTVIRLQLFAELLFSWCVWSMFCIILLIRSLFLQNTHHHVATLALIWHIKLNAPSSFNSLWVKYNIPPAAKRFTAIPATHSMCAVTCGAGRTRHLFYLEMQELLAATGDNYKRTVNQNNVGSVFCSEKNTTITSLVHTAAHFKHRWLQNRVIIIKHRQQCKHNFLNRHCRVLSLGPKWNSPHTLLWEVAYGSCCAPSQRS